MTTNIKPIRPNKQYGDAKAVAELSRGVKQVAGTDALKPARGEGRPRGSTTAPSAQPVPLIPQEHVDLIRKEAIARKYAMQAQELLDDPSTAPATRAFAQALVNNFQRRAMELKAQTPDW